MDAATYYAPSYFAPSYFHSATVADPSGSATAVPPYYAPTYFPPSYFYAATAPEAEGSSTAVPPYYAPTYFPPSYFYAAKAPEVLGPSTVAGPYNAPTYFAASYFYGGPPPTPTILTLPEPRGRDSDAYAALVAMIEATGVFEGVIFGAANERSRAGSDTYPLAVVTPKGWEESDEYDPISIVRRGSFAITVVVKSQDGAPQLDLLDRLSAAIQDVVDRSDLAGTSLAARTKIRSGRYEPSSHYPEQTVVLEGEFSSIIEPAGQASATNQPG